MRVASVKKRSYVFDREKGGSMREGSKGGKARGSVIKL